MTVITHPIAWFLKTLRQWRIRERHLQANYLANEAEAANLYDERNKSFWYLLPPC